MWWSWVACTGEGTEELPPDQDGLRVEEWVFVDGSRETPALGELAAAPDRTLRTRVWIGPATGEEAVTRPLLVVAHGFDGAPEKFEAFATDLANAGLVVAAPAFPVTTFGSGAGVLGAADLENQPADLAFVLDALLAEAEAPRSPLWRRFDPDAVATLGHSLGGATVLGWTRFDDPDPRVKAVATLSPAVPLTSVFGVGPSADGPPILLAHGIDDETLDWRISVDLYGELADPVWLLGLTGAGHSDPIESQEVPALPPRAALQDAVLALVAEVLEGEPGAVGEVLGALSAAGNETSP
jgi:dienelactone hydrolase